jgi:hypothetical protein
MICSFSTNTHIYTLNFCPHPGEFDNGFHPHSGDLTKIFSKVKFPGVCLGGGGGIAVGIDWYISVIMIQMFDALAHFGDIHNTLYPSSQFHWIHTLSKTHKNYWISEGHHIHAVKLLWLTNIILVSVLDQQRQYFSDQNIFVFFII